MAHTIGHNGRTGWVCNPRAEERSAKRAERAEATREAWDQIVDWAEGARVAPVAAPVRPRRRVR